MKKNTNDICITLEDLKKVNVPYKTKASEVLKMIGADNFDILALKVNNEIRGYEYELVKDSTIEFVKLNSDDGYRIYTRTLKMILYMALTRLYSESRIEFVATISKDQYFTAKNFELTEEKIKNIKKEMQKIIDSNFDIVKRSVTHEEAQVLYTASNDECKLQSLKSRLKSYVSMYFCNGMYNHFYGILAPTTGYIKNFDLKIYENGGILVIPNSDMSIDRELKDNKIYDKFIAYNKLNQVIGLDTVGHLNEAILKGKTTNIIQISEAIHNRKLVELVLDIEKRHDIKMILIAGPSSSGKTTFAQKLGVQLTLTGYNPIKISMDNYFKERKDNPLGPDGKYDFETVDAIDIELFNAQMKDLISGKKVELPEFNFLTGCKEYRGKFLQLTEKDVLIVEGIHALNPILTTFTPDKNKYKIYIAPIATLNIDSYTKVSSTDTRVLRRMLRDYTTRGHSVERTFDLWPNVKKGEEKYIFPFVNSVDFIYNSSLIYEPCVIRSYAQPLLLQITSDSPYYSESRRLYEYLNNFISIDTSSIPIDSIMREFIGEGCFER